MVPIAGVQLAWVDVPVVQAEKYCAGPPNPSQAALTHGERLSEQITGDQAGVKMEGD